MTVLIPPRFVREEDLQQLGDAYARIIGGESRETAGHSMDADYGLDIRDEVLVALEDRAYLQALCDAREQFNAAGQAIVDRLIYLEQHCANCGAPRNAIEDDPVRGCSENFFHDPRTNRSAT